MVGGEPSILEGEGDGASPDKVCGSFVSADDVVAEDLAGLSDGLDEAGVIDPS